MSTKVGPSSGQRVLLAFLTMLNGETLTKDKWAKLAKKSEPFDESSSRTYGRDVTFIRRALHEAKNPHEIITGPDMSYSLTNEQETTKLLPAVVMADIILAARALPESDVERLLDQLQADLADGEKKEFADDIKLSSASYEPIGQAEQVLTMFKQITAAINQKQMVDFHYNSSNSTQPKSYRGQPFAMFFETHYFYAVMQMKDTNAVKMFRLDRIQDAAVYGRGRVIPHAAFSLIEHRKYTATLSVGPRLWVTFNTDLAVDTIRDQLPSAKLLYPHHSLPAGWQQLKVHVYLQGALLWLRSQGAHVKVVDPPSVIEQLRQDAQKVLALYPER